MKYYIIKQNGMRFISLLVLSLTILFSSTICAAQDIKKEQRREVDGFTYALLTNSDNFKSVQLDNRVVIIPFSKEVSFLRYNNSIHAFQVSIFKENGIYESFINREGKEVVVRGDYDECYPSSMTDRYPFFKVKKNKKVGILDCFGDVLLPMEYDNVYMNDAGHFVCVKDGIDCIRDFSGKEIIPYKEGYTVALYVPIADCYIVHKTDAHRGVLNSDGTVRIPLDRYQIINANKKGYFDVRKDENWGVCDINGKEIVKPKYGHISYDEKGFTTFDKESSKLIKVGDKLSKNTLLAIEREERRLKEKEALKYYDNADNLFSELKEMFEQAYEMPDANVNDKIDAYLEILKKDPQDRFGYFTHIYNNIGVLCYNSGNKNLAKDYFVKSVEANPGNSKAKDNLKGTKGQIKAEKWEAFGEALSAFGEGLQNYSAGQQTDSSVSSYDSSGTYEGSYTSNSSGSSSSNKPKRCDECLGNGKCSGKSTSSKYHCHGSGKCYACNGKKYKEVAGHPSECGVCNATGKCKYCNGTGKCKKCNGTGHL